MELLTGVVSRFSLKGKDIRELFFRAFSGSFRAGQKIVIDPRFFREERRNTLAQAIVAILLCPEDHDHHGGSYDFQKLEVGISSRFNSLNDDIQFSPPGQAGQMPSKSGTWKLVQGTGKEGPPL
jgi:hypothetical protein